MSAWDDWNNEKLSAAAKAALHELSRPGPYDDERFESEFHKLVAALDQRQLAILRRLFEELGHYGLPEDVMLGRGPCDHRSH